MAHSLDDEKIAFDLRREYGISLPVVPMYDFGNDEIRDLYARTRLVIGMRGHAGMIPFGVGTPIVSLISHPKMAYFLADIERPEWGVSVHDKDRAPSSPSGPWASWTTTPGRSPTSTAASGSCGRSPRPTPPTSGRSF
ncbi:hypothetical protein [Streptomyces sp. MNU103]|uniref:hypothetical protein n=1 Tax=Streptomyces sp. MNU103 TaxID=2560024 RepID=UPI001E60A843|nr:hypothetical protein [Streptomyces sp. MNU103]